MADILGVENADPVALHILVTYQPTGGSVIV